MEGKEIINRHRVPARVPHDTEEEINRVKELDAIALVKRCAADVKDAAAWREFLRRYLGKIGFFLSRSSYAHWGRHSSGTAPNPTARASDAEDLSQEVLERLVADECGLLKRFVGETEAELLRYLRVVSSSVVIDEYRRLQSQRRAHRQSSLAAVSPEALDRIGLSREDLKIERAILIEEIAQMVEDLLQEDVANARTRDRHLLIFRLYVFNGLSITEISRYRGVNISKQAVDKIIAKITARLRERLGRRRG